MFSILFAAFLFLSLAFGLAFAIAGVATLPRGGIFPDAVLDMTWPDILAATPFTRIGSGVLIALIAAFDISAYLF